MKPSGGGGGFKSRYRLRQHGARNACEHISRTGAGQIGRGIVINDRPPIGGSYDAVSSFEQDHALQTDSCRTSSGQLALRGGEVWKQPVKLAFMRRDDQGA